VNQPSDPGHTFADYLQILWERRRVILFVVVLATLVGFVSRGRTPAPLYRSQVTMRVHTFQLTATGRQPNSATSVPPAEIESARSAEVATQTAKQLGMTDDGVALLNNLEVSTPGADLLQLGYTGRGADTTRTLDAYAKNYVTFRNQQDLDKLKRALDELDARIASVQTRIRDLTNANARATGGGRAAPIELQTQITASRNIYQQFLELREQVQLDYALADNTVVLLGSPISQRLGTIPTRTLRLLAGPVVGLLLGCALALIIGILRPRITSREGAEERLGYPVLAIIPYVKLHAIARDPLQIQRRPWGAEGIRMLFAELQLIAKRGENVRVVVVTTTDTGDGATTVATNLAASYSASRRSVALLRADRAIEVDDAPSSDGSVQALQVFMHRDGFAEVTPRITRQSGSARIPDTGLNAVVEDLARDFDVVVVDAPAMLASADAMLLAGQGDVVLLVLRQHRTHEMHAVEAIDLLRRHRAKLAGVVLNAARPGIGERYRTRASGAVRVTERPGRRAARDVGMRPPVDESGPVEQRIHATKEPSPAPRASIETLGEQSPSSRPAATPSELLKVTPEGGAPTQEPAAPAATDPSSAPPKSRAATTESENGSKPSSQTVLPVSDASSER
jgi:Mrp family chromosome partitioning ATPase/capsular polysaccharide biosynthesis protein